MPKLKNGEQAESVKRRADACEESTLNRITALKKIQQQAEGAIHLAPHFRSFAALCSWESEDHGVTVLSPKTLRRYIENLYAGGQAQFLVDMASASNSYLTQKTRQPPAGKQKETERRAEKVLLLTQQYGDLLDRFIKVGISSDAAKRELTKHFQLFRDSPGHLRLVK